MTKKAIPRIECIRQVDLFRIGIASGKWCIVHMLQAENVYTLGIQNRIRKGGSVLIGWNRGKYSSDMKEKERECWTALCGFSLLFFMPNIMPQDHITAIWRNFFLPIYVLLLVVKQNYSLVPTITRRDFLFVWNSSLIRPSVLFRKYESCPLIGPMPNFEALLGASFKEKS